MLTSRKVDGSSKRSQKGSSKSRGGTSQKRSKGAGSKNTRPKNTRAKSKAELQKAKTKATKAAAAKRKAEQKQKRAEKSLKRLNDKAKTEKKKTKRETKRSKSTTTIKKLGSTGIRRGPGGLWSTRKSTRKGFERQSHMVRNLMVAVPVVAVLAATTAFVAYHKTSVFDVEAIEVAGAEKTDGQSIVVASEITAGDKLVDIDAGEVSNRVEVLPWVDTVRVQKKWNGTVTVTVTERTPIAALDSSQGFVLIDGEGRQLELVGSAPSSHIPVSGVDVSGVPGEEVSSQGLQAVQFMGAISPVVQALVVEVSLGDGRLEAQLDATKIDQEFLAAGPTIEANFGPNRELEQKMASLEKVLTSVDLTCVERIDLSAPSKPTVLRTTAAQDANNLQGGDVDC